MMLCPLCRAFPRFESRVTTCEEGSAAEMDKLFITACWIIAALERTHPCAAHPRILRRTKRLAEMLVGLIEEGEYITTPTAAMASEATARKEIR